MNSYEEEKLQLSTGLEKLGLTASVQDLLDYLHLLKKWNHTYNLTSIRDISAMITKHLLDSLAISPWLKGPHLLDVGAGAGFPGIPIALAHPQLQVTLLDSNGKKVRFMKEAKRVLDLKNVEIVESRAEDYAPTQRFDTVMCRALTELHQLLNWTKELIAPQGQWLAMKGHRPDLELAMIQQAYQLHFYQVPGLLGDRCCVIIQN